ncbi:ABC transporter permease [bacterium]|jgi:lipopolysaccharide transport system permease protein|nr:ABC transporter permease [bacterium]
MTQAMNLASRYVLDLWQLRYFWLSLVRVDLRHRYRRSVLGLGWSLLKPMGMTAVICVIFTTIFGAKLVEFAPFVLIGMTFWGFITETVLGGCTAFYSAEGYLRQAKLPLAIFPLRVALGAGFHFVVMIPIIFLAVSLTTGPPSWTAVLSLLTSLILLFVIGWGLALLSGLLTVAFPDMKHILELTLQIVFYLTPIIYPPSVLAEQRFGSAIMQANPFSHLLTLVRAPLLESVPAPSESLVVGWVFALILVGLSVVGITRTEKRLIYWL